MSGSQLGITRQLLRRLILSLRLTLTSTMANDQDRVSCQEATLALTLAEETAQGPMQLER